MQISSGDKITPFRKEILTYMHLEQPPLPVKLPPMLPVDPPNIIMPPSGSLSPRPALDFDEYYIKPAILT